ncbi:MAG: class II fructose-bisphosphate aldolase [Deltaproteobacteria bacterium]|nr:class II fructose-bisphosphate aldolase [Deltaproteobacteria bacterium]
MAYENLKDMLWRARKGAYAVGAFNIVDPVTVQAVIRAAEAKKAPVIVQTSAKTVKLLGCACIAATVKALAVISPVPVALHLDHCMDIKVIRDCIDSGWSSVMIDASSLPFEENVRLTSEVVEMARPHNVTVEGELGAIVGVEDEIHVKESESHLADPRQAVEFVKRTGVDVFAPAIGTAHGVYKGEPKIAFDVLSEINARVECCLAIHGGTGLSDEVFSRCIREGGTKINVSTQIKHTFRDSLFTYMKDKPGDYEPVRILEHMRRETQSVVESFIDKFGSAGKA